MNAEQDIRFDDAFLVVPDAATPDYTRTIDLLNELYIAESRSFFRYLESWEPYTDAKTIGLRTLCRRMMKTSYEHSDRLAHLLGSLGGVTVAGAYAKANSHANYTSWTNLLPRFTQTKQDMIARGQIVLNAMPELPGGSSVAPALLEMLNENRADLLALQQWTARLSG